MPMHKLRSLSHQSGGSWANFAVCRARASLRQSPATNYAVCSTAANRPPQTSPFAPRERFSRTNYAVCTGISRNRRE